jgi:hypothetical protein
MKALNTQTGLFFVRSKGFVAECRHEATELDESDATAVRHCYLNVTFDHSKDGNVNCECPKCAEEATTAYAAAMPSLFDVW